MGLLRFLLALSVIINHSYPLFGYRLVGGGLAVSSFFMISGFYMALILNEKYVGTKKAYKLFISNRFLRIYPLYWVMLTLFFLFSLLKFLIFPNQVSYYHEFFVGINSMFNFILNIIQNITLLISPDYLFPDYGRGHLIIYIAYTLQAELLFYLIAPFIAKKSMIFLFLLAIPFSLITFAGFNKYIPFPHYNVALIYLFLMTFIFFLFGIMSYKLYHKLQPTQFLKKNAHRFFSLFLLLFLALGGIIVYRVLEFNVLDDLTYLLFYLVIILGIPFAFGYSKKNTFDRTLGELSYPMYLSHLLIVKLFQASPLVHMNHNLLTLIIIVCTVIFSLLLMRFVEEPIEQFRQKRYRVFKK